MNRSSCIYYSLATFTIQHHSTLLLMRAETARGWAGWMDGNVTRELDLKLSMNQTRATDRYKIFPHSRLNTTAYCFWWQQKLSEVLQDGWAGILLGNWTLNFEWIRPATTERYTWRNRKTFSSVQCRMRSRQRASENPYFTQPHHLHSLTTFRMMNAWIFLPDRHEEQPSSISQHLYLQFTSVQDEI